MASATVDLIINTIDKGSQNAVSFAKKIGNAWKDLSTPINQSLELIGKVQQAFDAGFQAVEHGAAVAQLTESFERMNEEVWKTPDLLDRMRESSRGTIKDFDLMSGLMTLTAGTSKEMSQAFADASPQLLEISKAANKLNPALGDTAFMYESISTGIKRSSTLILDNLGIVIKQGEVYDNYAESLGKATSELTAAEKQYALLNAVLEKGDTLIEQAGGNIDSLTDPLARFTVVLGEAKDAFLAAFAGEVVGGVDDAASGLGDMTNQAEAFGEALGDIALNVIPVLIGATEKLADATGVIGDFARFKSDLSEALSLGIIDKATYDKLFDEYNANESGSRAARATLDGFEYEWQQGIDKLVRQYGTEGGFITNWADNQKPEAKEAGEELAQEFFKGFEDLGFDVDPRAGTGRMLAEQYREMGEDILAEQEELAELVAEGQRELAERLAHTGDLFTQALSLDEDLLGDTDALYDALLREADAAGASAEQLALLGTVTGQFTEEQAEAALKVAAMQEKIEQLGAAIADGMKIGDALQELRDFQTEIENMTIDIIPEFAIAPGQMSYENQLQEWIGRGAIGIPDIEGGGGVTTDIAISIGANYDPAAEAISVLDSDYITPLTEETHEVQVEALIEGAKTSLAELKAQLDAIPRNIDVSVTVHKQGIPSTINDAVSEEMQAAGAF